MQKGIFITFEGTEGSGKSTQIDLIKSYLLNRGYEILVTEEPGGTVIGNRIRNILLDRQSYKMDRVTEVLLYAASRAQLVAEVIKPALEAGKIVISDRYVDSSIAYQGFGRGLEQRKIVEINEWLIGDLVPDLTILLNIMPEKGLARIQKGGTDRIEQEDLDFHRRVANGFLELSKMFPARYRVLDATQDTLVVHNEVVKLVEEICQMQKEN